MASCGNFFAKFLAGLIVIFLSRPAYANDVADKLENQKTVSGVITGKGVDTYTFQVAAGSSFMVNVSESGNHVDHFSPWLKLIGPDKQVKGEWGQEFFGRMAHMGAEAGEWKVELSRHDTGATGGSYRIDLVQIPGAKGRPLEPGKSYNGAIIRGAVDVYTITGTVGTSANLTLAPKGGAGLLLTANVYSPAGGDPIAYKDCKETCQLDVDMKTSGEYTALIWRESPGDDKGVYSVSLQDAKDAAAPQAHVNTLMGPERSYTGSITGGAVDVFNIDGAQPNSMPELFVTPHGFSPLITVFGPDGELLGTQRCEEACTLNLPPLRQGIFKVMVWRKDEDGPAGTYAISQMGGDPRQARIITTGPVNPGDPRSVPPFASETPPSLKLGPRKIENGKPVIGSVKGRRIDSYTFTAAKGSSFIVNLIKKNREDKFSPMMNIVGPDKQAVGTSGQEFGATGAKTDAAAGEYRIDVGLLSSADEGGGEYELNLLQIPGATGPALEFDKPRNGTISSGRHDVYTLNGTQGVTARVTLKAARTSGKGFMPSLNVYTSDGAPAGGGGCMDICKFDVPMTGFGAYILVVSRDDQLDTRGDYSVSVKRKEDKDDLPEVTAEDYYRNAAADAWPENMVAMHGRAEIYLNGQFLTYTLEWPAPYQDRLAAQAGDVLKQISWGDFSAQSDIKEPIKWWRMAADQGSADARNRLAIAGAVDSAGRKYEAAPWYLAVVGQVTPDPDILEANKYLTGSGQALDRKQAEKLYKAAAERGVAQAQYNLAVFYTLGIGGKPDYLEAGKWYGKAALQGLIPAENNLGELYEHGTGAPHDDAAAAKWYQKAADAGYPLAQYNLAHLLAAGRGVPKDPAKATGLLKKAADSGYAEAQADLDVLQGKGGAALSHWQKSSASGDRTALRKLVETARQAGIDPASYDDILATYRVAAKEINPEAFLGLADLFAKQNPPDDFEAYFWYSLAAETAKTAPIPADERDATVAYASGEAAKIAKSLWPEQIAAAKWRIKDRNQQPLTKVQEAQGAALLRARKLWDAGDEASAVMIYIQSAHQGVANGQAYLCDVYEFGRGGVGQDVDKAIDYCKQSVRNGSVTGATTIGDIYRFGVGVPVDFETAAKWYEMDASRGMKKARDRLGWLYLYGIPNSGKRAIAMYEKAASLNDYEADDSLGMVYLYGMAGVPKDIQKALKWYLKAADRNENVGSIQAAAILKDNEPHDYARALKLINTLGDPVSINDVAFMFEKGLGVKGEGSMGGYVNLTAMDLYKKAADMCYGRAMYNIGRLIETGADAPAISATPVKADPALARKWMERAAGNGSVAAAVWLAARDPDAAKTYQMPPEEVGFLPEPCPAPDGKKEQGK